MKKIGILIVIVVMVCVIGYAIRGFILSRTPDDGSATRDLVEYFNDDVDLKLLLYGEDIKFPEELEYEKISSLENEVWQKDNDYVYLIINDLSGTVNLDQEKYLQLLDYANKNLNFNFYYIGTDDLVMINENSEDANLNNEDMSYGYVVNEGNRISHLGVWSKNDHQYLEVNPELLSDNICSAIMMNVKSNE